MKKQNEFYETPEVEIVVVNVEKGFATSDGNVDTGEGEVGGGGDEGGFSYL